MAPPARKEICDCGNPEQMADHPSCPVEFDAALNEYHIVGKNSDHYWLIYYCPFCGGSMPKSKRSGLFQKIPEDEKRRLCELTKDMRTVRDVMTAFGEPDVHHKIGMVVTTPERDGRPETTQNHPIMIYRNLSDVAEVHAIVYPEDRIAIRFQGKGIKRNAG